MLEKINFDKEILTLVYFKNDQRAYLCRAPRYSVSEGDSVLVDTENEEKEGVVGRTLYGYEHDRSNYEFFLALASGTQLHKITARIEKTVLKYDE